MFQTPEVVTPQIISAWLCNSLYGFFNWFNFLGLWSGLTWKRFRTQCGDEGCVGDCEARGSPARTDTPTVRRVAEPHADDQSCPQGVAVPVLPPLGVSPGRLPRGSSCPGQVHSASWFLSNWQRVGVLSERFLRTAVGWLPRPIFTAATSAPRQTAPMLSLLQARSQTAV